MPPFQSRSTSSDEDRAHQVVAGDAAGAEPEALAHRRREVDRLRRAREDAAAGRDPLRVVVRASSSWAARRGGAAPARRARGRDPDRRRRGGGRRRRAVSRGASAARRCRRRRPTCRRCRRAVKTSRSGSMPSSAKCCLRALPRAARGDRELLVVVALRAARREGVAEPEVARQRERVGRVGEMRRALVGRDDQVRVVAVAPHDAGGRQTLPAASRLSVRSSRLATKTRYCASASCRDSLGERPERFSTKPPFAPTGTINPFLSCCVRISPSTSTRRSSVRSLQRSPPRATGPPRRWMPCSSAECTKISRHGRGGAISGPAPDRS